MTMRGRRQSSRCILHEMFSLASTPILLLALLALVAQPTHAVKFHLPGYKNPPAKCIWNAVHPNQLVIVTANVGKGERQRVDIEIVDSSPQKNQYLSKRNINGETRLAVTSHAEGEVGVCFRNYLDKGELLDEKLCEGDELTICG